MQTHQARCEFVSHCGFLAHDIDPNKHMVAIRDSNSGISDSM